jgi:predicted acylesterase/phospholipase RssA
MPGLVEAVMAILVLTGVSGCASVLDRAVPPASAAISATVPGLANVRFWGDEIPKNVAAAIRQRMPSIGGPPRAQAFENGRPVVNYLALSGGGSQGAFGAGLLTGWTKAGNRPKFEFVTGISAGALIAPFAFLGPAYDRQLEEIWTQYGDDELVTKQPLGILFGAPAAVDTKPLADLIARYIDAKVLAAVAAEYRKGRVLLIGTTNIDAKRPVVWNMGEIALSRDPRALQLFRDVLLASASIPGIMPPVKISVDSDGQTFDELHVDGGVTRQVFLTPVALKLSDFDQFYSARPLRRVYVVRNGTLTPRYKPVDTSAAALASTSISALLDNQAAGDIYRIYVASTRDGAEFRLAADQSTTEPVSNGLFDKDHMKELFTATRDKAARGYPWLTSIPELHAAKN